MRRALAILWTLLIGCDLAGCRDFTLIDNFALDTGDPTVKEADSGTNEGDAPEHDLAICWPDFAAARVEIRSHGYTPSGWPATAAWLDKMAPVKSALPPCE